MNKALTLGAAILAALTASVASADNGKHLGRGYVNAHYRPAYVAPVPVRNHYYAPAPVRSYYAPARGYWRNGRWIAPVVVGAAISGIAIAAAAPSYGYVAPTYYAPPVYAAPVSVSYAAPSPAGFDYADVSGDGFITYEEAAVHPHWQRNFSLIDRNHDGYLSRDEVIGWRLR